MRVQVSEIDGSYASTPEAGQRLLALIEPVLARGEPVELDFEGVRYFSVPFFCASIFVLVKGDTGNRLSGLLRYENLLPQGQSALESTIDYAIRCRDNPRWAEGLYEAARKFSERE
jgi:hypothetical protein